MSKLSYKIYNDKSLVVRGDKSLYENEVKKLGGRWNEHLTDGVGWTVPRENESKVISLIKSVNIVDSDNTSDYITSDDSDDSDEKEVEIKVEKNEDKIVENIVPLEDSKNIERRRNERERQVKERIRSRERINRRFNNYTPEKKNTRSRERNREKERDRERDKEKERDRERDREREKEREREREREREKNKKKYFNEDRMLYYKTFKKNESNRRRDLSSSSELSNNYSSSSRSSSSSDSFPSPETPRKRVKYIKHENENKNYRELFLTTAKEFCQYLDKKSMVIF